MEWEDRIAEAKANGGRVITPNNLPIRSIKHNHDMLEHEHGDHPTYMFPVEVVYTGELRKEHFQDYETILGVPGSVEQVRDMQTEEHALIYTDGYVALTMYETCYALFSVTTGRALWGKYVAPESKLSDASLAQIRDRAPKGP